MTMAAGLTLGFKDACAPRSAGRLDHPSPTVAHFLPKDLPSAWLIRGSGRHPRLAEYCVSGVSIGKSALRGAFLVGHYDTPVFEIEASFAR